MTLIAVMQMLGGLFTEGINLFLICTLSDELDIIVNLVAFGCIAQIDDFYAAT